MKRAIRCVGMPAAFGLLVTAAVAKEGPRVVHVFVALADNQHQGIIPVPTVLGDGRDPARNLYWGAAFGVKTYFKASKEWELISSGQDREKSYWTAASSGIAPKI